MRKKLLWVLLAVVIMGFGGLIWTLDIPHWQALDLSKLNAAGATEVFDVHGQAAGTLYGALSALSDRGWIRLLPVAEGSRKKEYMLTEEGRRALRGELERLRELVACGDTVLGGSKDE